MRKRVTDPGDFPQLSRRVVVQLARLETATDGNITTEIERLRAALHRIAFERFGPPEASATRVLLLITELARETLKLHRELPAGRAR